MNKNKNVLRKRWQAPFKTKLFVALTLVLLPGLLFGSTININQVGKTSSTRQESSSRKIKQRNQVQELTTSLVTLNQQYQAAEKPVQEVMLDNLLEVASARQVKLAALIEEDPQAVLQVALPKNLRANLPRSIRNQVEQHVELDGELEVLCQDGETASRLLHFLKVGDQHLGLHFADSAATNYLTGAKIRVKGVRVGDHLALESSKESINDSVNGSVQPMAMSVVPNTLGEQKVLVLLVNFLDKQTQPYTIQQARDLVFGTVNNYYREVSYQQTWLTGEVFGWYTLPINTGDCYGDQIANHAKQAAAAAGVNLSAYNRYIYVFPSMSCGYTGWANIGGNPSEAWINGSLTLRTVAHELGHCLGLYHATAMDCHPNTVGSSCPTVEYGDIVDMMGKPGITGHFHAYQKERLGWLNYGASPPATTVQSSGIYRIDPYESVGSTSKALKILKSTDAYGRKTWYYVEVRRPIGFDSFVSSNSAVMNGVIVHMCTETGGYDNYLLDITGDSTSWSDAPLTVGHSFNDPNTGMTITPVSVDNTGAAVNISFGPIACVRANPSLSLSPSQSQWVRAGGSASYTVSVVNNDNSGCSTSAFNLQASVPSGWTANFVSPTLNISSGLSVTTTLQITAPAGAIDGFYNLGVTASNNANASYSASISATCVVVSSLGVTVSPDQASYTRSQTANLTAFVNGVGSPVSGAQVNFTITKPDGSVATGTSITGANGSTAYSYRFNRKRDPVGTYQVTAVANLNGVYGSSTTGFTVR